MDEKILALSELIHGAGTLREGCLYPFTLSNGCSGLFEVMLFAPDSWALLAYPGEEAVQSLLQANAGAKASELERLEAAHSVDGLALAMDGEELTLTRLTPRRVIREMNGEERAQMGEIVAAALSQPAAVKPPRKKKQSFPAGECPNEVLCRMLPNCPVNGEKWVAHIFLHLQPVAFDGPEPPFYPFTLMLLEERSGLMFSTTVSSRPDEYEEAFLSAFADVVKQRGRPKGLIAVNGRTEAFFKPLCSLFGIGFEKRSSSPTLRQALESYEEYFSRLGEEDAEPEPEAADTEEYDDTLDDAEGWNALNESLLQLVENPDTIGRLSTELLLGLLADMESGELRRELEGTIRAELRRRK